MNTTFGGYSIMHGLVLAMINLHTKFEMSSYAHSKDNPEVPKFKNGSRVPDHVPFGGKSSHLTGT